MRPAKSFWKNVQLCRTTCQWFCQRIRLERPGASAWLTIAFWISIADGRSTSMIAPMPSSGSQASFSSVSGVCVDSSATSLPMQTGIAVSSSATIDPAKNSAINSPRACRA
jgi:hypothetical protein